MQKLENADDIGTPAHSRQGPGKGMTLNTQAIFERNADLMVADMDGEMVMMDVEQGSYFAINEVGAHVWTQLEKPQSLDALSLSVQGAFASDDLAQIQADLDKFLSDLSENNLIREIAG